MFQLQDKIAIVTGGSSGIGESISLVFSEAGATVCILDINESRGRTLADQILSKGHRAKFFPANVGNQEGMVQCFQEIISEFGGLDILVNNAGISHIGTLESTPESEFDRIYQINVKGVYNGMYAAIPHMKKQSAGVILNMGSAAAELGLPDRFAYSMSKGAVLNMTYTVARDYVHDGIRCNSIAPGRVHTPFVDQYLSKHYPGKEKEMFEKLAKTQPIGRMAKPREIAMLALYLCSDEAAFITGTNVPIDGGFIRLNT